jgi:DNA invertase Pin-like site-specific DNA recombinase
MQQVRTRLEGQRRQYDLRERAQALGFQHVVVIDEDQGGSGTGSVERPGFGRVLGCIRRVHEGGRQVWAVNEEQTQLFMDAREA